MHFSALISSNDCRKTFKTSHAKQIALSKNMREMKRQRIKLR